MGWFRRSREVVPTSGQVEPIASTDVAARTEEAVRRTEQALVALAMHTRDLADRIDQLDTRLDDRLGSFASVDDVFEVRAHSAKVAAEVSRLSVNLRARIDEVRDAQRELTTDSAAESVMPDLRSVPITPPWADSA